MKKKVFVIILNWNGKKDTVTCLESLNELRIKNPPARFAARRAGEAGYELRIIVVDNGSTDESVEEIQKLTLRLRSGQEVKIIRNKRNLGFAGGNNVGIKYALRNGADHIVILNNDTIVPKNFFALLENGADLVGPVIKFRHNGKWIYDYGGYLNRWIGRPTHYELPYLFGGAEVAHQRFSRLPILSRSSANFNPVSSSLAREALKNRTDSPRHFNSPYAPGDLDYLSGCCLAIKKEVFGKIGFFDERFFLYFEDIDFCLRAQKEGFEIALEPKVVIFHKLGGTAGRWSKTAIFHNLRSNFIFIGKHLGYRKPIGYFYLVLLSIKIMIDRVFSK